MAGQSSRFFKKGYKLSKYELPLKLKKSKGKFVFDHSLLSFENYMKNDLFVFVIKNEKQKNFLLNRIKFLKIKNFKIINLKKSTRGQAESVFLALKKASLNLYEELYIFNIDTILLNFKKCRNNGFSGLIETFIDSGTHWSFAQVDKNNFITKTAEKKRISKYCSNGLYYFKNIKLFYDAYTQYNFKNDNEYFIAPIYNQLIKKNYKIKNRYQPKKNMIFIGTPIEYEKAKKL